MFTIRPLKVKSITTADPITSFLSNAADLKSISRAVCFYRIIGIDGSDNAYTDDIKSLDTAAQKLPSSYVRINYLNSPPPKNVTALSELSCKWLDVINAEPTEIMNVSLPIDCENETFVWTAKKSFCRVLDIFKKTMPDAAETVYKNFAVKMLYWVEQYLKPLFKNEFFPKIVFVGEAKKQDSFFIFYCALIGCDVLYIHPDVDMPLQFPELQTFSKLHEIGVRRSGVSVPEYKPLKLQQPPQKVQPVYETKSAINSQCAELSYEELALFTTSVVMIAVFNSNHECEKTGSGVVISETGYILTNWHVVSGGSYFAVRFENDDESYLTSSVIKYHTDHDLAVIRVEKHSRPISLTREKALIRGERIMAIGSPLGLFNTVSDGIISGFRHIEKTDMIQFTAPTSGGSSGGALIDTYGRLVGIIQGGFSVGQNLNLAVDYQIVYDFVRPLIPLHTANQ